MKKFFCFVCISAAVFFLMPEAEAKTVYLKNGEVVVGEVLDENSLYLEIELQGLPMLYFWDEIIRVEDESEKPEGPVITEESAQPLLEELKDGVYTNYFYKFSFALPEGWVEGRKMPQPDRRFFQLEPTMFNFNYVPEKDRDAPALVVQVFKSKLGKDFFEMAQMYLDDIKLSFSERNMDFSVEEALHIVRGGKITYVRSSLVFDEFMILPEVGLRDIKLILCFLANEKAAINISFLAHNDARLEMEEEILQECLNSFTMLDKIDIK